jgi:lipid-A-disaccharide synthase
LKYYLIAGEKSGEQHAAALMQELQKKDSQAKFRFWGGEAMQSVGGELVRHYQDMAFMGFGEVVKNIGKIWGFLKECKKDILAYQPDVLILVDYAGFNMRIAKFAKKHHLKVYYYISPKLWAWNQDRAKSIKKNVDKMFVIMPFEQDFYKKYDYEVDFVGNPVYTAVKSFTIVEDIRKKYFLPDKPIIAILPGSRKQELLACLETLLSVTHFFPEYQFVIGGVSSLPRELYAKAENHEVRIVFDETYNLLSIAKAAVLVSGTVSLEAALFKVPQVVCYRTKSMLTYALGKMLIKVKFASLVNLILDKPAIPELIQNNFTSANLVHTLQEVLTERRLQIIGDYRTLDEKLRTKNVAETTANLMWKYLNENEMKKGVLGISKSEKLQV